MTALADIWRGLSISERAPWHTLRSLRNHILPPTTFLLQTSKYCPKSKIIFTASIHHWSQLGSLFQKQEKKILTISKIEQNKPYCAVKLGFYKEKALRKVFGALSNPKQKMLTMALTRRVKIASLSIKSKMQYGLLPAGKGGPIVMQNRYVLIMCSVDLSVNIREIPLKENVYKQPALRFIYSLVFYEQLRKYLHLYSFTWFEEYLSISQTPKYSPETLRPKLPGSLPESSWKSVNQRLPHSLPCGCLFPLPPALSL